MNGERLLGFCMGAFVMSLILPWPVMQDVPPLSRAVLFITIGVELGVLLMYRRGSTVLPVVEQASISATEGAATPRE